jgi:hypothetical protein
MRDLRPFLEFGYELTIKGKRLATWASLCVRRELVQEIMTLNLTMVSLQDKPGIAKDGLGRPRLRMSCPKPFPESGSKLAIKEQAHHVDEPALVVAAGCQRTAAALADWNAHCLRYD